MLNTIGSILVQLAGYSIIRIEEKEQVPLSFGIQTGYYGITMVVMMLVLVLFLFSIYISCCIKYRNRIKQINQKVGLGWNLIKLRQMEREAELRSVSEFAEPEE